MVTAIINKDELEQLKMKARNWDDLMQRLHRLYDQVRHLLPPDYDHGALLSLVAYPTPHPLTPEEYVAAYVVDGTARDQRKKQPADDRRHSRALPSATPAPVPAAPAAQQAQLAAAPAERHTPPPQQPKPALAPPAPEPLDDFTFDDDDPM